MINVLTILDMLISLPLMLTVILPTLILINASKKFIVSKKGLWLTLAFFRTEGTILHVASDDDDHFSLPLSCLRNSVAARLVLFLTPVFSYET